MSTRLVRQVRASMSRISAGNLRTIVNNPDAAASASCAHHDSSFSSIRRASPQTLHGG
ncbi:hypothetical protein ACFSKW_48765 [Nonomuraea mangrovi]|uniref:Uncharacterized protein n=1 Tax=Nonomuraea mangrovi TaxID=2316207 RepID=A0ABW4TBQ1_9ACTN